MPTLINQLQFVGLVVGVPSALPHGLSTDFDALIPDLILPGQGGYTIAADDTNVTVTRTDPATPANLDVWVCHWHSTMRQLPPPLTALTPQPFIPDFGAPGSGGNTLDQAYNQGGPGIGRAITANAGAVEITNNEEDATPALDIVRNPAGGAPTAPAVRITQGGTATDPALIVDNSAASSAEAIEAVGRVLATAFRATFPAFPDVILGVTPIQGDLRTVSAHPFVFGANGLAMMHLRDDSGSGGPQRLVRGDTNSTVLRFAQIEMTNPGGGAPTGNYFEGGFGSAAAVSPANRGRIRFNEGTNIWEVSENGGAYVPLLGGAGSYEFVAAAMSVDQVDPVVNDDILFDTVLRSLGASIALNVLTGTFTLQPGTYRLQAEFRPAHTAPFGDAQLAWFNQTAAAEITGSRRQGISADAGAPRVPQHVSSTIVTLGVASDVSLRIMQWGTAGVDISSAFTNATVEKLA